MLEFRQLGSFNTLEADHAAYPRAPSIPKMREKVTASVLPDEEQEVPEVGSQWVGGHFEYVVNTRYATQMLKYCWSLRETANELYRTTSV